MPLLERKQGTMPIRPLPPEVAGKIAAGEVVERPASVVKELIENSIDAGARQIQVEIREGGRRFIRVADDGCGIPGDEVALAFARHATSKLSQVADLDRIATLGFRGEALASIAAVSRVSLLTRPRDQQAGHLARLDGGEVVHEGSHGAPAGTVVTVENLFQRVPARLKFLRQPQTEAGHIHTVVSQYALAYPAVGFSLTSDGRQTFHSAGKGQVYDVLIAIYGLEVAEQMLAIVPSDGRTPEVTGYVGVPSLHRATRSYITLFVNRRWIQDRSLSCCCASIRAWWTSTSTPPSGRSSSATAARRSAPSSARCGARCWSGRRFRRSARRRGRGARRNGSGGGRCSHRAGTSPDGTRRTAGRWRLPGSSRSLAQAEARNWRRWGRCGCPYCGW
jgi:DNA mismatch repair protein MutL